MLTTLVLTMILGCGGSEAPTEAPTEAPEVQAATPAKADPACTPALAEAWESFLADGCPVERLEGHMPVSAKVLAKTPYALEGHWFKDGMLREFFTEATAGCDGAWYTAKKGDTATIEGEALACVEKIQGHEEALLAEVPMQQRLQKELLRAHGGRIVDDVRSAVKKDPPPTRTTVRETDDGSYTLEMVEESEGTPEGAASFVLKCPPEGACEVVTDE